MDNQQPPLHTNPPQQHKYSTTRIGKLPLFLMLWPGVIIGMHIAIISAAPSEVLLSVIVPWTFVFFTTLVAGPISFIFGLSLVYETQRRTSQKLHKPLPSLTPRHANSHFHGHLWFYQVLSLQF